MNGTEFNPDPSITTGKDRIVSLTLPKAAESIADGNHSTSGTFRYFTNLKTVSAEQVTNIGSSAFAYCTSLISVDIPAAESIGGMAFVGCSSLSSVEFPVASIIDNAFYSCSSLTSVSFPASASIIHNPFQNSRNLISITVTGSGSLSVIEGGKALVRNGTHLVAYPSASGNITINNIISIGHHAFEGCTSLTSVSFPAVTSIGSNAFLGCSALTSVSLPMAAYIDGLAFQFCTSLTSVSFPASADVGEGLFLGCRNLTTITLTGTGFLSVLEDGKALVRNGTELVAYPSATGTIAMNAITSIGGLAFDLCENLTSVSFPAVTSIGNAAFYRTGTAALTITLGAIPPTLGIRIFDDSAKNVTVRFPADSAAAYGNAPTDTTAQNWGNAFRGMGWSGTAYLGGTVNGNINLTYVLING
jgi:hypothetical protein